MDELHFYEGYIVFVLVNKGTKSERYAPLLIQEEGESQFLFRKDENPFSSNWFTPYHLAFCRVSGYPANDRNQIVVAEVEEIDDPIKARNTANKETPKADYPLTSNHQQPDNTHE